MTPEPPGAVLAQRRRTAAQDPWFVRWTLITLALGVIGLLIVIPVVNVFANAFADGPRA